MPATLGSRVARTRLKLNMYQAELAEKIGVSRTQVSNIERDESETSVETLRGLSRALGVSADFLLGIRRRRTKSNSV